MISSLTYEQEKKLADRHGRLPTCNCIESHEALNPQVTKKTLKWYKNRNDPSMATFVALDRLLRGNRCPYCGTPVYWEHPDHGELRGWRRSMIKALFFNLKTGILRVGEELHNHAFLHLAEANKLIHEGYIKAEGHLTLQITDRYNDRRPDKNHYKLTKKGLDLLNHYRYRS